MKKKINVRVKKYIAMVDKDNKFSGFATAEEIRPIIIHMKEIKSTRYGKPDEISEQWLKDSKQMKEFHNRVHIKLNEKIREYTHMGYKRYGEIQTITTEMK